MQFFRRKDRKVDLSNTQLQRLLDLYNLDLVTTGKGTNAAYALMPKGVGGMGKRDDKPLGFSEYWFDSAFVGGHSNEDGARKVRYDTYNFMDANSSESSLTLDTYADESVMVGTVADSPVDIEISDKEISEKVKKTLSSNGITTSRDGGMSSHREIVRQLAKFGDFFIIVKKPKKDSPINLFKVQDPSQISADEFPGSQARIGYTVSSLEGGVSEHLEPWECVHFKLPDMQFFPYGRSILEPMRAPYQQLQINEALLALSRASKVERLIIKVPTTGGNPTTVFTQIQAVKSQLKNILFGNTGESKSRSRLSALTDILFLPSSEGYEMDRLQSSIDISSIEDVEYFQNKVLMASRLPKSYLLADDVQELYGQVLASQDLKFARSLVPLQQGYVEGLTELITSLVIIHGGDPEQVKVDVRIPKPQALTSEVINHANDSISLASEIMSNFRDNVKGEDTEDAKLDVESWKTIMKKVTRIPEDLLDDIARGLSDGDKEVEADEPKPFAESIEFSSDKVLEKWAATPSELWDYADDVGE